MGTSDLVRRHYYLTREEDALLEDAARNDGRSKNGFLRKLIRDLNQPLREARLLKREVR